MAAPTISSVTTNKSSYNKGDTISVTINYTPGTSAAGTGTSLTISGTATDEATGQTQPVSGTITLGTPGTNSDATTIKVTDSDGRSYAKQSDDGSKAIFTTTA